jgi:hypothetical protein
MHQYFVERILEDDLPEKNRFNLEMRREKARLIAQREKERLNKK